MFLRFNRINVSDKNLFRSWQRIRATQTGQFGQFDL
jgi:hypothetical protein